MKSQTEIDAMRDRIIETYISADQEEKPALQGAEVALDWVLEDDERLKRIVSRYD